MANPILQFGTGGMLQAHLGVLIDEALAAGQALGHITAVGRTDNPGALRRVAALEAGAGYPVRIRGARGARPVDEQRQVRSVTAAYTPAQHWQMLLSDIVDSVQVIVSDTGELGYSLSARDYPRLIHGARAPRSFPAQLLVLLHHRYRNSGLPITIAPCEALANNAGVLRDVLVGLAVAWDLDDGFIDFLCRRCVWVSTLADRIVSGFVDPVGAITEPYAAWVMEAQPGMTLPCSHPQVIVADQLDVFERRKIFLLDLGLSLLAEHWLQHGCPRGATVRLAMQDPVLRGRLEKTWAEEVLPIFDALGESAASRAYLEQVRGRLSNPHLDIQLADLARHHEERKRRRLLPVVALAEQLGLHLAQCQLRTALALPLR